MKTKCLYVSFAIVMMSLFVALGVNAQQIPDGVRYKKASDEVNQKARRLLEEALNANPSSVDPDSIFGGPVACGPLLWEAIKDSAGKEIQTGTRMVLIVNAAKPVTKEGKGLPKPEQKRAFWKLFIDKVKGDNKYSVRNAEASEIAYYWATIPFDIEEPLQVIDFGDVKVLVNFITKKGQPKIFWMDIVGDLKTLK